MQMSKQNIDKPRVSIQQRGRRHRNLEFRKASNSAQRKLCQSLRRGRRKVAALWRSEALAIESVEILEIGIHSSTEFSAVWRENVDNFIFIFSPGIVCRGWSALPCRLHWQMGEQGWQLCIPKVTCSARWQICCRVSRGIEEVRKTQICIVAATSRETDWSQWKANEAEEIPYQMAYSLTVGALFFHLGFAKIGQRSIS